MTERGERPGLRIERASLHFVRVTHKTCWSFLRFTTLDGLTAEGEASLGGRESELAAAADRLVPLALQDVLTDPPTFAERHAPADMPEAAIVSAIDQALWSLRAIADGKALSDVLGERRERIPVYANINRRTETRTPEGFAASARAALAAGHVAFKVAPFDEVSPAICAAGDGVRAMQPGLERIAAVRDAVGPRARVMVDCHWRFDEATARALNDEAAKLGLHWVECPLPETSDNIPALVRLRRQCNGLGLRQAGLETGTGWNSIRAFCEGGAYDVVMPDVKYAGGLGEIRSTAAACAALGIEVSPHNPSGPICHAASLQLSAALDGFDMLELQFDESHLFDDLVGSPFARIEDGRSALPEGPGLGVALDAALLDRHADRPARAWRARQGMGRDQA